jgi:hypothetical protein
MAQIYAHVDARGGAATVGPPLALPVRMSPSKAPPLPARALKPSEPAPPADAATDAAITEMERAFALTADEDDRPRESFTPQVTFSTWDDRQSDFDVDAGIAQMRRDHLAKYVKVTMAGSVLICVVAVLRMAIGGSADEEIAARATFAKQREVATEIATLPRSVSTLTARTQAALRVEHRRDAAHARTASRAKAFW